MENNNIAINAPLPCTIHNKIIYIRDSHGGNNLWKIVSQTEDVYLVVSRSTIVEINKNSVYFDNFGKCYCSSAIVDINVVDDISVEIESEGKWQEWFCVGDTWTEMWKYCWELNG